MAIFYNHIKGCGVNSTGQANSTTDLWSWLKWASTTNNSTISATASVLPEVLVAKANDFAQAVSCGKIITSNASNQAMEQLMRFNAGVYTTNIKLADVETNNLYYDTDKQTLCIDSHNKNTGGVMKFTSSEYTFNGPASGKTLKVTGNTTVKNLHVGSTSYSFPTASTEQGTLKVDYKCEAQFFNAISDRRAKTNITPLAFPALTIVKQLPIYTFNYLNVEEPVIGLIAQEAAEHDLNGFNMVDNRDATGECGDLMQIKESKLVYVLWKAVQELSAEVEELKAEIRNLK